MGTRNNPGKYDCYAAAAADEPMFVLLARDKSAPEIVRSWARAYELRKSIENSVGDGPEPLTPDQIAKFNEAMRCADTMEKWKSCNREAAPKGGD